ERGEVRFSHLNRGEMVSGTWAAIRKAEALEDVSQHDYELRQLRIAALGSLSVWLKNGTPEADRLIPASPPAFLPLEQDHVYTPGDCTGLPGPVGVSRLRAPRDPGAGGGPAGEGPLAGPQQPPPPRAVPEGGVAMEPSLPLVRLFMEPPHSQPI